MKSFVDKMDQNTVQIGLETFAAADGTPTPYHDVDNNFTGSQKRSHLFAFAYGV